jgi:hypothetical protein
MIKKSSKERAILKTVIRAVILFAVSALALASEPNVDPPEQQAMALANEFVGLMKPQLQQALAAGGPVNAIAVCADIAPRIADALSAQSGWTVKRVSLKARNASRAVPDGWEETVLLEFDRRRAAGEKPADIRHADVVGGQYRYMQAQMVEPVCLLCHGQVLTDEVTQVLREYYPDDSATGYSLGDVRGAISLSRSLSAGPHALPVIPAE